VIGRNILRFAAFGAGYYCENSSLALHLAGVEARTLCAIAPSAERGALIQHASAGLAAQTEMPNRTSFSEVPAARLPPFGDSRVLKSSKSGEPYKISIDRSKSMEANCMSLVQEETFAEAIKP